MAGCFLNVVDKIGFVITFNPARIQQRIIDAPSVL